jgi:hypothetical protein
VMPQRSTSRDIKPMLRPAVPALDYDPLPRCSRIGHPLGQGRQARPFDAGSASGSGPGQRWRFIQAGIEPQPGDHIHMWAHGAQQLDDGKAAVGDRDDPPVGQPAGGLEQRLTSVSFLCRRPRFCA